MVNVLLNRCKNMRGGGIDHNQHRPRLPTEAELQNMPSYDEQLQAQQQVANATTPVLIDAVDTVKKRNDVLLSEYIRKQIGTKYLTYCVDKKTKKRACVPLFDGAQHASVNWDYCRFVDFMCDFEYTGDVSADGTFIPFAQGKFNCREPLPVMSDDVTFVSCCVKRYDNKSPYKVTASFNVMNDHKAYKDADVDMADMQESLGVQRGAFVEFEAETTKEEDRWALHVQSTRNTKTGAEIYFHYTNPDFITMTHRITGDPLAGPRFGKPRAECCQREVDAMQRDSSDSNTLWNGLIRLPAALCKEAGLNLYSDDSAMKLHLLHKQMLRDDTLFGTEIDDDTNVISDRERKESKYLNWPDSERIRCYYAMDFNHVLAWSLHVPDHIRRQQNIECERLDITLVDKTGVETRVEGPWLVPDTVVRSLMENYQESWANRVDIRKDVLNTTGFIVAPFIKQQGTRKNVNLRFTVHCKCIVWRPFESGVRVAPRVHPGIANVGQWLDDDGGVSTMMMNKLKL